MILKNKIPPLLKKRRRGRNYLFLVQIEVGLNGASYRATYHRVVTDAEEAHHLNMSGN